MRAIVSPSVDQIYHHTEFAPFRVFIKWHHMASVSAKQILTHGPWTLANKPREIWTKIHLKMSSAKWRFFLLRPQFVHTSEYATCYSGLYCLHVDTSGALTILTGVNVITVCDHSPSLRVRRMGILQVDFLSNRLHLHDYLRSCVLLLSIPWADSRFAPIQWETVLLYNDVSN